VVNVSSLYGSNYRTRLLAGAAFWMELILTMAW